MQETEFDGEELFKASYNKYGYPVVAFASNDGDSMIYMIQGHHPPIRRVIATFNYVVRTQGIYFLTDRQPDSFLEWSFAKYFSNDEDNSIRIELGSTGKPVTYFEA